MKHSSSVSWLVVAGWCAAGLSAALPANASVNVTQHHNNLSRDGLYIAPAFTQSASASLTRDTGFDGTIAGTVYAQPLYVEGGPSGPVVIAVTNSNNVYALNATTGAIVWQRNVGTPVTSGLPCGNINPLGITGTPVVDLASRSLLFDAEVSGAGHQIYSLNVDTGTTNAGWPVTVSTAVPGFDSDRSQSQRAAPTVVGNTLYVPYGGRFGDCGSYHGRVIGVQINNPASIMSYSTTVARAGIWGPGGIASDGTDIFVTTGNGSTAVTWSGAEAIIRLQPGPVFSGSTIDYWAPVNWSSLDAGDTDLGGSGPIVVDVPGANPSALVCALGKDGNAYLVNRSNLGGVSVPVASASVNTGTIIQAAASYRTSLGTYVVFRGSSSATRTFRINAANPPTITTTWAVTGQSGRSSPFVTSTDGTSNTVVWVVGSGGDNRLHGYNGDTGAVIFAGGGVNELMAGTRGYNANAIAARKHVFVAADNKVYSFSVPVTPLSVSSAVSRKTHGGAGNFDIPLPGVECRSGGGTGDYMLLCTFSNNIENGNASVTGGAGSVSGTPVISGNTMTINLTGVANAQTVTVTLSGVTDQFLQALPDTPVAMTMLIGDTNNNSVVNASDVAQTKGSVGQPVASGNFRTDVNASGDINSTDVTIIKSHIGQSLSAPSKNGARLLPPVRIGAK